MKRLTALVLALVLSLSLVACGGADKQPAIDAFNKASTAFDAVAKTINANAAAYDEEVIKTMTDMANVLKDHKALLESDEELTQEKLDEMIAWYGEVEKWVADVKAEIEALPSEPEQTEPVADPTEPAEEETDPAEEAGDLQAALDAYTATEAAYNVVAVYLNENPDAADEDLATLMTELAASMQEYYAVLTGEEEIAQEDLDAMIVWFGEVEAWAVSAMEEFGIE